MADALRFTLEMVDKLSGPAGRAANAVNRLVLDLKALREAVSSLQALGALKLNIGGKVRAAGGKALPAVADPNATGAMAAFKVDPKKQAAALRAAERAKAQELKASTRAEQAAARAHQRAVQQKLRFAQRADNEIRKAQKQAQANLARQTKAAEAAFKRQRRSVESIAKADKAHEFVNELASNLGLLVNPATLAAAAVVGLGAAFAFAAVQGASLVLSVTEAKGDTLDMLEAMLGTAEAADRTYAAVRGLTRDFAISLSDAQGLAQSLAAAGITNESMLKAALTSVAQVDSVIKGAGAKVEKIFQKASQTGKFEITTRQLVGTGVQLSALYEELAQRTGMGVKEVEEALKKGKIGAEVGIAALTAVIDKKFGALAGKQALDFSAQVVRLRDNFRSLFDGVNTGPFLNAFKTLVDLFDEATPAGRAFKTFVTGAFNALFKVAEATIPYIRALLKGLVIIGLRVYIAFRPLIAAIRQAFGQEAQAGPKSLAEFLSDIGRILGFIVGKFVGLVLQKDIWADIVTNVKAAALMFRIAAGAVALLTKVFLLFYGFGQFVVSWVLTLPERMGSAFASVALAMIDGFVSVLQNPERLYQAVMNVANVALDKFKGVFGISSPSKVMAKMGGHVVAGFNQGLDANRKSAAAGMANVVDMGSARSRLRAGSQGAATSSSTSQLVLNFHPGAISIGGGMSAEEARESIVGGFIDALEQVGLANGAGEGVAA